MLAPQTVELCSKCAVAFSFTLALGNKRTKRPWGALGTSTVERRSVHFGSFARVFSSFDVTGRWHHASGGEASAADRANRSRTTTGGTAIVGLRRFPRVLMRAGRNRKFTIVGAIVSASWVTLRGEMACHSFALLRHNELLNGFHALQIFVGDLLITNPDAERILEKRHESKDTQRVEDPAFQQSLLVCERTDSFRAGKTLNELTNLVFNGGRLIDGHAATPPWEADRNY